ncbi:hypothetical protein H7X46_18640 [Pseudonocardia sp. C8]|uniref:hypothetical protein n=1 Tax=Pseudonocardia sp. C8 TaxID=2762759 RepID=UPI001643407C|nr:hypothetical protein [Pseudonocardia sp. C8]MBC3193081.1 hypothetical protein [Pseudonocardia sp. C8]
MTMPATTYGLARDLVFLAVAGDDELAALGIWYATVAMTAEDAPAAAVPPGALVLHWTVPRATPPRRQRVCLSMTGPGHPVRAVLERAGAVLRGLGTPDGPVVAVVPSTPRIRLDVAGRLVTTGYDVLTG